MLKCRYTRARIPAFINHELPVNTRRYVARHLDECPRCRNDYEHQKALTQRLTREMPLLGQPDKPALNRIRANVLAELVPQPEVSVRPVPRPRFVGGLVLAAMVVAVLLPLAAAGTAVKSAVPEHPSPRYGVDISTPSVVAASLPEPTLVAFAVQTAPGKTDMPEILDNTPATPEPDMTTQQF